MIGCRLSSPRLWISIARAYCVVIMLICLNVFFIFMARILSFVSKFFIDGMCVVAIALGVETMSGATLQPLVVMLLMSG